jgi:RNA polymerase sigma factor (sigma-70 family)
VPHANLNIVVRHLRWLLRKAGPADGDGALLKRFVADGDESAFTELVSRHGPMVLGACHRVLGDEHDADDAFQATFLVLVKKAGTLRDPATLGNWLYGVAVRVARKARTAAARRGDHEKRVIPKRPPDELEAVTWRDLRPVLDEELERLPAKYRAPLVLCCLEGHTYEEAAKKLGWANGTVCGRLSRAKEILRKRLVRRGLAPSAAVLTAALSKEATAAAVPPALFEATRKAALECAVGTGIIAGPVAALTSGALNAMFWSQCKAALLVVVTLAVLVAGAGRLGRQVLWPWLAGKEPEPGVLRDLWGDPLPWGALVRMGTNRLSQVDALAFSADGKTLVLAGPGRKVRFCDPATGAEKNSLEYDGDFVTRVALSPNGKTLALGVGYRDGRAGHVSVREVATGKELHRLKGLNTPSAFSPDGKCLATVGVSGESSVKLWDIATGEEVCEIPRLSVRPSCLAFSPDGKLLATNTFGLVRFWDSGSGREVGQGLEHDRASRPTDALAFAPDGKTIATGDFGAIMLWDVDKRERNAVLQMKNSSGRIKSLAFTKDGKTLASAIDNGKTSCVFWDVATGKEKHRLDLVDYQVDVVFSPDGQTLAATCGSQVRLWDADTGKEPDWRTGHHWPVTLLAYSPDGKMLASTQDAIGIDPRISVPEQVICVWETGTGKLRHRLKGPPHCVTALAFTPDSSALVSSYPYVNVAHVWDLATGKERCRLGDGKGISVEHFAISPAGDVVALKQTREEDVWLYSTATGEKLRRVAQGSNPTFSPDGKVVATWSSGKVHLWDTASGKELSQFKGNSPLFWRASESGAPVLLSRKMNWDKDRLILQWDGTSDKNHHPPETVVPVEPGTYMTADSPDGRKLAVVSSTQVQLWDLDAGQRIGTCLGRAEWKQEKHVGFRSATFSVDGRTLATRATDGRLQLWEVATGEEIRSWGGPQLSLGPAFAFSPDGRTVAASDGDSILIWDVTGRSRPTGLPHIELNSEERERLWSDLNGANVPKAHDALWKLVAAGDPVVPFLREKLKALEADAPRMRVARIGQVLEQIGTPAARGVLEELVSGAPERLLTREARASLERLKKRP